MKKFNTPVSDFTLDEFKKSQQEAIDELFTETTPFTWAKLKEFCNGPLTEEQLSQTVKVVQEDTVIEILDASKIGDDHYMFDDEEFSVSKADFDPDYHLDGKYKTFEEALENEDYVITRKINIYLFEKF